MQVNELNDKPDTSQAEPERTNNETRITENEGQINRKLRKLGGRWEGGRSRLATWKFNKASFKGKLPPFSVRYLCVARVFEPATCEVKEMLLDLHHFLGSWHLFEVITGIHSATVKGFLSSDRVNLQTKRSIWFLWATILHPGAIEDLLDIATWGRLPQRPSKDFPLGRANPATAGKVGRKYQKHYRVNFDAFFDAFAPDDEPDYMI